MNQIIRIEELKSKLTDPADLLKEIRCLTKRKQKNLNLIKAYEEGRLKGDKLSALEHVVDINLELRLHYSALQANFYDTFKNELNTTMDIENTARAMASYMKNMLKTEIDLQ